MFCTNCGNKISDNLLPCSQCGTHLEITTQTNQTTTYLPIPKKSSAPLIIIACSVLAIIVITGVLLITFKNKMGPFNHLVKGIQSVIESDNADFNFKASTSYDRFELQGTVEVDTTNKNLEFDVVSKDRYYDYRYILYKDIMMELEDGDLYDAYDASDDISDLFDLYASIKNSLKNPSSIDWEELLDELGIYYSYDEIDFDEFQKSFSILINNLNDPKYLKSICNEYSRNKTSEGTEYSLDINMRKAMKSLFELFEPAFPELDQVEFDDFYDDYMEYESFDSVKLSFIIKNNKLTQVDFSYKVEDSYGDIEKVKVSLEITNSGNASLNTSKIKKIYDDAEYYYD